MNTVMDNVLHCIKVDGECLNNYERLCLVYWTEIDKAMIHDMKTDTFMVKGFNVHRLTSSESITRAMRKLVTSKIKTYRGDND